MKVISKQRNSRMCYICGLDNKFGLKAQFYNMEDNSVMTKFHYREEHQSFPYRVHGGLSAAMLDELAFRAEWVNDPDVFGVTMSMTTKFRKPVPYNEDIFGKGIIIKNTSKFYSAEVSLLDINGNVLTSGEVTYLKLPPEKISENVNYHEEMCYLTEDDIKEF